MPEVAKSSVDLVILCNFLIRLQIPGSWGKRSVLKADDKEDRSVSIHSLVPFQPINYYQHAKFTQKIPQKSFSDCCGCPAYPSIMRLANF